MSDGLHGDVIGLVKAANALYPNNHGYHVVREDLFGSYSIYTVEFYGYENERYTNFAIFQDGKPLKAFYYLADVLPYLDRRLSWRSLLIEQYGLVVGSAVTLILLGGILVALIVGREIPKELWLTLSAAVGYLFGNRTAPRGQRHTD